MTASLKTLTFGDDGSPAADVSWLFVNSHMWPGWRLHVVSAQLPELGPLPPPEETRLHPWDPPQPRHAFGEAGFAEIVHLTATGDPRIVLSEPTDLLVVGPRGPGLTKALHLGSTTEWLLLHPPAPLLIARHGRPVTRALVCADGSAHAAQAAAVLAAMPWVAQISVTVATVDDGRVDPRLAIDQLTPALSDAKACDTVILPGKPTGSILAEADRIEADLIVAGTRGLTGMRHLRLGSTAAAISRAAHQSVLIARAPEGNEV